MGFLASPIQADLAFKFAKPEKEGVGAGVCWEELPAFSGLFGKTDLNTLFFLVLSFCVNPQIKGSCHVCPPGATTPPVGCDLSKECQ